MPLVHRSKQIFFHVDVNDHPHPLSEALRNVICSACIQVYASLKVTTVRASFYLKNFYFIL